MYPDKVWGILFLSCFICSSNVKSVDFETAYKSYKVGSYEKILKAYQGKEIKSEEDIDYKILVLYVSIESNYLEIDKVLSNIAKIAHILPTIYYNSVYLFLERLLVLEKYQLGEKWGEIFFDKGVGSKKYDEGVYLYSCILYKLAKYSESRKKLSIIKTEGIKNKLKKRVFILKYSLDKKK